MMGSSTRAHKVGFARMPCQTAGGEIRCVIPVAIVVAPTPLLDAKVDAESFSSRLGVMGVVKGGQLPLF